MSRPEDIAHALKAVAERIEETRACDGAIRDANGNTVGSYDLTAHRNL